MKESKRRTIWSPRSSVKPQRRWHVKKDHSKTSKPADKGKVKDLPSKKLTAEQERSVKGGGLVKPKDKKP